MVIGLEGLLCKFFFLSPVNKTQSICCEMSVLHYQLLRIFLVNALVVLQSSFFYLHISSSSFSTVSILIYNFMPCTENNFKMVVSKQYLEKKKSQICYYSSCLFQMYTESTFAEASFQFSTDLSCYILDTIKIRTTNSLCFVIR